MADIKGILFDKDGTLVDFNATWLGVADFMAMDAAEGDRWKADRLLAAAGFDFANKPLQAGFDLCLRHQSGRRRTVVSAPVRRRPDAGRRPLQRDHLDAGLGDGRGAAGHRRRRWRRCTGRSYRLGVATNDSTSGAEKTLVTLGVAQLFDAAYGYDAVANPKPAPDTILAFCDLTGLKPAEIAMVGDNRHDLEMARAGGCGLAVGVLSGTGTREIAGAASPTSSSNSVADLPDFLSARVKETI